MWWSGIWHGRGGERISPAVLRAEWKLVKDGNSPPSQKKSLLLLSPATSTRSCRATRDNLGREPGRPIAMGRCLVKQVSRGLCRFQGRAQIPAPKELFSGAFLEDQVWEPSASGILQTGQGIPRKLWLRLSWVSQLSN